MSVIVNAPANVMQFPVEPRRVPLASGTIAASVDAFLQTREAEPDRDERELLIGFMRQMLEIELDAIYEAFPPVINSLREGERVQALLDEPWVFSAANALYAATLRASGQPVEALAHGTRDTVHTFLRRVVAFIHHGDRDRHLAALNYVTQSIGIDIYAGAFQTMPNAERRLRQVPVGKYIRWYFQALNGEVLPCVHGQAVTR